jgi:hypothetical protein
MRIFCDFVGHFDLTFSLVAVLQTRLGHELYFPNNHPTWSDDHGLLNIHDAHVVDHFESGLFLSFDQFMSQRFDMIISTAEITEPFLKSIADYHGDCGTFVRHIGNLWEQPKVARHLMTAIEHPMEGDYHRLTYIPEHPSYFMPSFSGKTCDVFSLKEYTEHYEISKSMMRDLRRDLHGFNVFQASGNGHSFLRALFDKSKGYVHFKANGGCGFTLREALFCGLPVIVNTDFCKSHHTLPTRFLKHGVNCVDFCQNQNYKESLSILKSWIQDDEYEDRCLSGLKFTKSKISWEQEAQKVKDWIGSI